MPRLAANLFFLFNELPFLERFGAAAKAGFDAAEFLFPYAYDRETVARYARDAGVEVALFNLPPGDWDAGDRGMAIFPERSAEFTQSLHTALAYAKALGNRRLHLMAGNAPPDDMSALARYRDALAEACDLALDTGVSILIEPLNHRDNPGYFLDDFDRAAALIDSMARPNLKLQFDIYHRQILHGDVLVGLRSLLPLIGHIQIASVPDRHEPGTGELNDLFILAELDRLGYDGFVGCEYRPRKTTMEGLDWRT